MGGALLQIVDRDTQKFAMKASSACINGEWVDVVKDPITDSGKKSKAGRVTLWKSGGELVSGVVPPAGWFDKAVDEFADVLETVYLNGKLVKEITFEEVRANARK
jgi:nicotinamide phosphoribosyltransferase